MAWDTEATRRKLLDAGARQFAAHGFAGGHLDAIGRDAGVNKERVYRYFGDKQGFFAAVLADRLDGVLDTAPPDGSGPEAIGAYAGSLFDRLADAPDLARLLAWESLELPAAASSEHREQTCATMSAAIRAALPGASLADAEQLLLSAIALVTAWWTLSALSGVVLTTAQQHSERREVIVRQVTQLAAAL
ncbi:TetR/AcrR family transcriptional regulator [Leifsonia sp. NPDC058194]|uniref:TetR/AcrR family transcriptional regulator n=1 Tax=Leifsonia sp. NPDC058194 TaxID=3346374 RepID=UPI0036DD28D5